MWRMSSFVLIFSLLLSGSAVADEEIPVLRIHGDDVESPSDEDAQAAEPDEEADQPLSFVTGYVDWEFVPIVEVQEIEGAVTAADAQRTLRADRQGLLECFQPTSYPGEGRVTVEVHLSYNGIPTSVSGMTDQVVRPAQARCVLRRAWGYQFPRIAAEADQPTKINYQITFIGQRSTPEASRNQARLLVERLASDLPDAHESIADGLTDQLATVERCAAAGLQQMPTDMVANEVSMRWHHVGDGLYRARHLDLTVINKTSSELPSSEIVDCYEAAISRWSVELENGERPAELVTSFYITVRPPGWFGL